MEFAESGARNIAGPHFGAGVDFNAGGAEPRGSLQGEPDGLPETSRLDSDFEGWHDRINRRELGSSELG
jgi:hypothetical protein